MNGVRPRKEVKLDIDCNVVFNQVQFQFTLNQRILYNKITSKNKEPVKIFEQQELQTKYYQLLRS